ncbi:MAG TPA: glycosyltransferase family 39 protein [Chthoniobacterales bacterium]|nr:glycosyltransferase family 39 protein [Chthoniobacterales bacterium]
MISRTNSLLIVILLWAAVYLPALGSLAIKGEEGRRILPGIAMLESGNYLVPQVGGEAYFRKPPLINWLVAASFKIFGTRNEWTARLPSAISVLAVAIAFMTVARASLGPRGSTIAAIIWLTNIGIIEKGRLIEIEGLYTSLFGLAIIFWLSFWEQKKSAWLIWIPACIFLGLGLLAKGPVHLLFFYGVVLAVLWKARSWRILFHPAHFVGLLIMVGIFAAWAIPFAHTAGSALATTKWSNQFTGRLKGSDFQFLRWVRNIPQGLLYLLPWTILLPLIRFDIFSEKDRQFARALVWGAGVPFVLVLLVPGSIPRYAMPALVPGCWLLAMTLCADNLSWPRWLSGKTFSLKARQRTVVTIAILACIGIWTYAAAIVPKMQKRQRVRRLAAQIDATVPRSEPLYALDPNYQPIFFYVHSNLVYASEVSDLPLDAVYLLVRPQREDEVVQSNRWLPRRPHRALPPLTDYRKETILLLKIE